MNKFSISGPEELHTVTSEIIPYLQRFPVAAFYGEMGAGKTTFIKSLCQTLGVTDVVNSPTFSLINEYKTAQGESVYHFDFYRMKTLTEVYDLGYEDYFYSGCLCLIEWPELIEPLLPAEHLKIQITVLDSKKRTIEFVPVFAVNSNNPQYHGEHL